MNSNPLLRSNFVDLSDADLLSWILSRFNMNPPLFLCRFETTIRDLGCVRGVLFALAPISLREQNVESGEVYICTRENPELRRADKELYILPNICGFLCAILGLPESNLAKVSNLRKALDDAQSKIHQVILDTTSTAFVKLPSNILKEILTLYDAGWLLFKDKSLQKTLADLLLIQTSTDLVGFSDFEEKVASSVIVSSVNAWLLDEHFQIPEKKTVAYLPSVAQRMFFRTLMTEHQIVYEEFGRQVLPILGTIEQPPFNKELFYQLSAQLNADHEERERYRRRLTVVAMRSELPALVVPAEKSDSRKNNVLRSIRARGSDPDSIYLEYDYRLGVSLWEEGELFLNLSNPIIKRLLEKDIRESDLRTIIHAVFEKALRVSTEIIPAHLQQQVWKNLEEIVALAETLSKEHNKISEMLANHLRNSREDVYGP